MDFTVTYKTLYQLLFHYCNKLLASNNIVDSEELAKYFVSEAFTAAYYKWDTFVSINHVKSYLFICVKNKSYNNLTQVKRHGKSNKEILYLNQQAQEPCFIDYDMINADVIGFIYESLQRLAPRQQKIVNLYIKGATSHQIAKELGIAVKTVLNHKLKAIIVIKKALRIRFGH